MTSFQTDHTGWLRHRKHSIPLMQRWYHKHLSIPWSTLLHNNVIQNEKITSLFVISNRAPFISEPDMMEPRSGNNRLLPNAKKPIAHEHTRIGPNRPQPINQSEMVYTNQSELAIRDQSDHSICALTNYYWSVTNRIRLVNSDQSKNYPNNFLIG